MGDFYMVEAATNWLGGDGGPIQGRESKAWANLICKCSLLDTFQAREGQLKFSWDNHHLHRHNPAMGVGQVRTSRILSRLDIIYAPECSRTFPCKVVSKILPSFALLDHGPVLATIKCGEVRGTV